jgi:hypothetical protein
VGWGLSNMTAFTDQSNTMETASKAIAPPSILGRAVVFMRDLVELRLASELRQ